MSVLKAWTALCAAWIGGLGLGCVISQTTDGTRLLGEQVAQVAVGKSTRADVARLLGAPDEIIYSNQEHDPLFERAYTYQRTKRRSTFLTLIVFSTSRADVNSDHVIVFFDDSGVVEDVSSRLDREKPRYGTPWGRTQ